MGPAADYLMIVPEALRPAVAPLVAMRQAQGLTVLVAPLEAVNDEFNGGRKSSYAIKRFVRYAFEQLGRALRAAGRRRQRGSAEPAAVEHQGLGPDPGHLRAGAARTASTRSSPRTPGTPASRGRAASGTRRPTPTDLFIGRLPVRNLAEAQGVVAKLVAYENFAADQTWRNALLLISDDEYSTGLLRWLRRRTTTAGPSTRACSAASTSASAHGRRRRRLQAERDRHLRPRLVAAQRAADPRHRVPRPPADHLGHARRRHAGPVHASQRGPAVVELPGPRQPVGAHAREPLSEPQLRRRQGPAAERRRSRSCSPRSPATRTRSRASATSRRTATCRGSARRWCGCRPPARSRPGPRRATRSCPTRAADHINVEWARTMFANPPHDDVLGDRGARVVLGETIALALADYVSNPFVQFDPNERGIRSPTTCSATRRRGSRSARRSPRWSPTAWR